MIKTVVQETKNDVTDLKFVHIEQSLIGQDLP